LSLWVGWKRGVVGNQGGGRGVDFAVHGLWIVGVGVGIRTRFGL